jgi:hypothetical protein
LLHRRHYIPSGETDLLENNHLAARLPSSTLFSNPRSNFATVIPSDFEIINSVRIVVFFNPRSIFPTKVRCSPSVALYFRDD